jgi:hypothetical protein
MNTIIATFKAIGCHAKDNNKILFLPADYADIKNILFIHNKSQ